MTTNLNPQSLQHVENSPTPAIARMGKVIVKSNERGKDLNRPPRSREKNSGQASKSRPTSPAQSRKKKQPSNAIIRLRKWLRSISCISSAMTTIHGEKAALKKPSKTNKLQKKASSHKSLVPPQNQPIPPTKLPSMQSITASASYDSAHSHDISGFGYEELSYHMYPSSEMVPQFRNNLHSSTSSHLPRSPSRRPLPPTNDYRDLNRSSSMHSMSEQPFLVNEYNVYKVSNPQLAASRSPVRQPAAPQNPVVAPPNQAITPNAVSSHHIDTSVVVTADVYNVRYETALPQSFPLRNEYSNNTSHIALATTATVSPPLPSPPSSSQSTNVPTDQTITLSFLSALFPANNSTEHPADQRPPAAVRIMDQDHDSMIIAEDTPTVEEENIEEEDNTVVHLSESADNCADAVENVDDIDGYLSQEEAVAESKVDVDSRTENNNNDDDKNEDIVGEIEETASSAQGEEEHHTKSPDMVLEQLAGEEVEQFEDIAVTFANDVPAVTTTTTTTKDAETSDNNTITVAVDYNDYNSPNNNAMSTTENTPTAATTTSNIQATIAQHEEHDASSGRNNNNNNNNNNNRMEEENPSMRIETSSMDTANSNHSTNKNNNDSNNRKETTIHTEDIVSSTLSWFTQFLPPVVITAVVVMAAETVETETNNSMSVDVENNNSNNTINTSDYTGTRDNSSSNDNGNTNRPFPRILVASLVDEP